MPAKAADLIEALLAFGLGYPGAHIKSPWPGHRDLAVNDKTFAYLSAAGDPPALGVKLPFTGTEALLLPFASPSAYGLGKSGWVAFDLAKGTPPGLDQLKAWLDESFRAQAPQRLVAELGAFDPARGARPGGGRGEAGAAAATRPAAEAGRAMGGNASAAAGGPGRPVHAAAMSAPPPAMTGAALVVERAAPADLPALLAIEATAFDPKIYFQLTRRQFQHHLRSPNAQLFVAREPGGPALGYGLGLTRPGGDWLRFYSLAVHPAAKGRSIGVILFEFFERHARDLGLRRMLLEIRADNDFLRARYTGMGYRIVRTVPEYYPDGMACLKLERAL